ncbi:T9SS type A sorting domain-containing protein, partial [Bacteroidota bacterium]
TYKDTIPNTNGCDSIITINLTILHTSSTINPAVCNNYTSPSGNYIWTSNGTYKDTIPNTNGCDSIITINLTILHTSSIINPAVCDNYTSPSGIYKWTTSGTYSDTIPNQAGCDSVITINLIVNTVNTSVDQSGTTLTAIASSGTFQWLNCDNNHEIIQGETNQLFTPQSSGNYAVEVNENECLDTSVCYDVTITGIIESNFNESIAAYPNPSNGNITISLENYHDNVILILRNLTGKVISKGNYRSTNIINFNINEPKGIYMIEIKTSDDKRALIKVLKN